jgi:hypothetical protein
MKKLLLVFCLVIASVSIAIADTTAMAIHHFDIKENPFAKDEVAVIATDTAGNTLDNIKGVFNFTMNGFEEELTFDKGVAFYRHKIDRSTFLYARHQDDAGTHSVLYYIYKSDKLTPVHIPWYILLAIPCALFLLAYMFKRFIIVAIIIFLIFVFFNYHNNLSIPTFFESIIDGLKNIF